MGVKALGITLKLAICLLNDLKEVTALECQFDHLFNGDSNRTYLVLAEGIKKDNHVKPLNIWYIVSTQ